MKLIMDWVFIFYWLEWIWNDEQQGDDGTILDDMGWGQYVIIDDL